MSISTCVGVFVAGDDSPGARPRSELQDLTAYSPVIIFIA